MAEDAGESVLFAELSYQIMQAAFEVHHILGPGFAENIYRDALVFELERQGIQFEREKPIQVVYKGRTVGVHRLDLVVDSKIVLELKAVTAFHEVFKLQLLSYLKATGLRLGILLNFGSKRVESLRIVN